MNATGVALCPARVIESKTHSSERGKVATMANLAPEAIHVGSTGVQLLVRDPTGKISARIAATEDSDIILRHDQAEALAARFEGELKEIPLVARSMSFYGIMKTVKILEEEPFKLARVSSEYGPAGPLFSNIDIFTERTGVGPIPITDYVLNHGFERVILGELETSVARPFFLIATQANPFARTEGRLDRLVYLMLDTYARCPEGYAMEIGKALEYIGYGDLKAQEVANMGNFSLRKEFSNYEGMVRQVGNLIGIQKKNKILNVAGQMDIGKADATKAIDITADLFSAYRTPQKPKVETREELLTQ